MLFRSPWGLFIAFEIDLNPWIAFGLFVLLWLVFANVSKERVPLYLTNQTTRQALKSLIEQRQSKLVNFMDLGCGLGGNVVFMAQQSGVNRAVGVETAPLPLLFSKLFTRFKGGKVFAQNLWKTPLQDYNFVYAFLSTEPMPRLWQKVTLEMQPGSVFVSNSFPVPNIEPSEIWELPDARQTKLFIYTL